MSPLPLRHRLAILLASSAAAVGLSSTAAAQWYCEYCEVNPYDWCNVYNTAITGGYDCYCQWSSSYPGFICNCAYECRWVQNEDASLDDLKDGVIEVPAAGLVLSAVPTTEELAALDRAAYDDGRVQTGVYFGDTFALLVIPGQLAMAYPLEARNAFVLRRCSGEALASFSRREGAAAVTARSERG